MLAPKAGCGASPARRFARRRLACQREPGEHRNMGAMRLRPVRTGISLFLIPLLAAAAIGLAAAGPAGAAASLCHAIAQRDGGPVAVPVALQTAAKEEVRIAYVGHSAFRIETPGGVSIVTDFSGRTGGSPPTVVTMNHAHATHYAAYTDPAIAHVLRGWNEAGGPARHDLTVGDARIRNVPTDLYREGVLYEKDGNSIFVFEVAGLCIGHLGHLHHTLAPGHIAELGRIDVLFAPVDGNYTLSLPGMIEIARQLRSSVVIPMHWFSGFTLQRFLDGMDDAFRIEIANSSQTVVSLAALPSSPTVLVLSPQ
jgi:L-ascorbate metabolism protein UlaG (beta-lactamase superfamily)